MKSKKLLATATTVAVAATTVLGGASVAFGATAHSKTAITTKKFWTAPTKAKTIDGNTITTAGHRAAQTLVEIVGLNNRAEQNMAGNPDGIADGAGDQDDPADNIWTKKSGMYSTYQTAGSNCKILGVFGSDNNTNPDPYYYNYFYNLYALDNGLDLTAEDQEVWKVSTEGISPDHADVEGFTLRDSGDIDISPSIYSKAEILIGQQAYSSIKSNSLGGYDGATTTATTYAGYLTELRKLAKSSNVQNSSKFSTYSSDNYQPLVVKYAYQTVYAEGESLQRLASAMNAMSTKNATVDLTALNKGKTNTIAVVGEDGNLQTTGTVKLTNSGTQGRYGNPLETANDYMLYVKGLSSYVYKEATKNNGKLKTVVVIDPCTLSNYDASSASKSVTWAGDNKNYVVAYDNTTSTGRATNCRIAEALENVTINLATAYAHGTNGYTKDTKKVLSTDSKLSGATKWDKGSTYAISLDVVKEADVIVLQGIQSDIGTMSADQFKANMKALGYELDKDVIIAEENPQCVYGMTCNSVESGLAYGFYMGYVYPEILDPVDASAYFYKKVLHVKDSSLQSFMNEMIADGVKNAKIWSTGADNSSTTLSAGWEAKITNSIQEGVNWYNNTATDAQKNALYFTKAGKSGSGKGIIGGDGTITSYTDEGGIFTSYDEKNTNTILKATTYDLSKAKVTVKNATYTGKALTPAVTVKVGDKTIDAANYKVAYKNNKSAGTATVTITAAGKSTYGTAKATFKIAKASQKIKASVKTKTVKYSKLKKASQLVKSISVSGTKGKVTYAKVSGSSKLTVKSSGKIKVKKGTKKGTYTVKVKIKAAKTANYNAATAKTVTVKVKVK